MSTLCQVLVLEIEQKTVESFCSYEAFILGGLDNKEIIKAMQDRWFKQRGMGFQDWDWGLDKCLPIIP